MGGGEGQGHIVSPCAKLVYIFIYNDIVIVMTLNSLYCADMPLSKYSLTLSSPVTPV